MRKSIALGLALIGLGLLLSLGPAARADGLDVKLISITSPVPPGGSVTTW
jgi:hypothetical protein